MKSVFFSCLLLVLLVAPARAAEEWRLDPLAWTRQGETLQSRNSGFALSTAPRGREVTVSAQFRPVVCEEPLWATAGVSVYANPRTYWHLALVKHPEGSGAKHTFELAMMYEGVWPSQNRLTCRRSKTEGSWAFGKDYRLELKQDRDGISGEIFEVESGRRVFTASYGFTAACADCGRPALHVTGGLKGDFTCLRSDVRDPVSEETAAYPAYPKGTGFFRVAQVDGRWTAVDPGGESFTVLGIDHVKPQGMFCEKLGYSPYGRHVKSAYPNLDAWRDETLARLGTWGFNTLGAGCDFERLGYRGFAHTIFLNLGSRLCFGEESFWIRKSERAPCTAFPNVFHPDFEAACDWAAAEMCTPEDPWLFGYFIDNELAWWGKGSRETGLFDLVAKLPPSHSARQALEKFVAGRPVTSELKRTFVRLVAERYFAITTAAIRKYDPNHLILGCRFAGFTGAHRVVWEAAAKHCDVVTFNCYPWADIDCNVVLDGKGGVPIREKFDEVYGWIKRPMMITEWSFPALDTGRPCLHGAGQRFPTQEGRVRASELFAKTILALPYFIGYDYFMWVDQPAQGLNRYFPEDSNYGLVQENGEPHRGITEMFTRLQAETGRWRRAGLPPPREVTPERIPSERERFLSGAQGDPTAVTFARAEDGSWTLRNDVGLELKGAAVKTWTLVSDVRCDGRRYGSLGGMVEFVGETGLCWVKARQMKAVEFVREGVCGTVLLTAGGSGCGASFDLTLRVTLAPGCRDFAADLVSLANTGEKPLEVRALHLRPYADGQPKRAIHGVPKLWEGAAEAEWELADGARYGLTSRDPDVRNFHFRLNEKGGQHADAVFSAPGCGGLVPGQVYRPPRPLSARMKVKGL